MDFQSALDLKHELFSGGLHLPAASSSATMVIRSRRVVGKGAPNHHLSISGIMLGVAMEQAGKGHLLAVRVQEKRLLHSPLIAAISRKAKGEVDVRYTGPIRSLAKKAAVRTWLWYRKRLRPLEIGTSIAHKDVTAGTIGGFVFRGKSGKKLHILSNNHVLVNVNEAEIGDEILQPGPVDGGKLREEDVVAHLTKFVPISFTSPNLVDCAIAAVKAGVEVRQNFIHGIGELAGVRPNDIELFMKVQKLGRTTGLTKGRVTAVALDDVGVDMGTGIAMFDNQIEIESTEDGLFCDGGDSGSLIVDESIQALALLFAGSDEGGSNGLGLTYANPILAVIEALEIRF